MKKGDDTKPWFLPFYKGLRVKDFLDYIENSQNLKKYMPKRRREW